MASSNSSLACNSGFEEDGCMEPEKEDVSWVRDDWFKRLAELEEPRYIFLLVVARIV